MQIARDYTVAAGSPGDRFTDPDRVLAEGLLDDVSRLGQLVLANAPNNLELVRVFEAAMREGEDRRPPRRPYLEAARAAFFALPVPEQRRILNGWRADAALPDPADVIGAVGRTFEPRLLLRFGSDGTNAGTAHQRWVADEGAGVIELQMSIGTTQRQALEAVDRMRAMIVTQWRQMLAGDGIVDESPDGVGASAAADDMAVGLRLVEWSGPESARAIARTVVAP